MRPAKLFSPFRRAFSLLEILIVVVIVALLCIMAYRGYSVYVEKGRFAACSIKIANFGKALQGYVTEHNGWPQEDVLNDADGKPPKEDVLWDWWFHQLKDQGLSEDDWYCPSDIEARKKEAKMEEEQGKGSDSKYAIKTPSYIPMKFGPGPYAPFDVAKFPWAIERFGHPDGMHKVMPNGTVEVEFNFKSIPRSAGGK